MKVRAITKKDFRLILQQDKRVYPTDSPVTEDILKSWYTKNPEFGMIYEDEKKNVVGNCVIIPLNGTSWEKLISGKLGESEMSSKTIFDNSKDKEIGIHIYHIEKIDKKVQDFHKIVLSDIKRIIKDLRIRNHKLKVVGLSGLCVTAEGIGLFENKFNCKERNYICEEHIMKRGTEIALAKNLEEVKEKKKKEFKIVNRCKMLVLYPNEKSLVWDYLK